MAPKAVLAQEPEALSPALEVSPLWMGVMGWGGAGARPSPFMAGTTAAAEDEGEVQRAAARQGFARPQRNRETLLTERVWASSYLNTECGS